MIVIDASIAIAWCFADETTPESDAVLDLVKAEGAWVPSLWCLEVANVLRQAERRGRINESDTSQRLEVLAMLPITTDPETESRSWGPVMAFARAHTLTVYDAAYLELASRLGLPLASKDEELLVAARSSGLAVIAC